MKTSYAFVGLFFGFLVIASFLGKLVPWILAVYVIMSVITFVAYGMDKSASKKDSWRTPEKTLQILGLCCGWPGGLMAQQTFRHKTSKKSFQWVFWICVAANCLCVAWFALSR
jgi:uncharacterized membrane protein YsdA (DUF1294 family)